VFIFTEEGSFLIPWCHRNQIRYFLTRSGKRDPMASFQGRNPGRRVRLTTSNRSPYGILIERNWLRPVSKGVNTLRARIRLGGYSPRWTSPSLKRRYGRTR
jgi:hypothetical protein